MPETRRFGRLRPGRPPVPFEVVWSRRGGVDDKGRPVKLTDDNGDPIGGVEAFHARAEMPGGRLLDLGDVERMSTSAITGYLAAAVVSEDGERFHALMRDPDRLVDIETLTEVLEWLVTEVHVGTPTTRPSSSPDGRSVSGASSPVR